VSALLRREWMRFATAATFLTRAPWIARWASGEPAELARSARWFPLVGVLVGACGAAVYAGASLLLPTTLAALLALAATVALTGAFHEDGLADAADGLFGGYTKERRLEIMRDSRIGTFGGIALVLSLALRWQALVVLGPSIAAWVLPAAHAGARFSSLLLARALPYGREGAPNKPIADGIGAVEATVGGAVTAAALLAWVIAGGPIAPALAAIASALVIVGCGRLFAARIGGITGDCLGAANQVVEIAILLVAVAFAAHA